MFLAQQKHRCHSHPEFVFLELDHAARKRVNKSAMTYKLATNPMQSLSGLYMLCLFKNIGRDIKLNRMG